MRPPPAQALFILLSASVFAADASLIVPFFHRGQPAHPDWIGEGVAAAIGEVWLDQRRAVVPRQDRIEALRRLGARTPAPLTIATIGKAGELVEARYAIFGYYEVSPGAEAGDRAGRSLRITARSVDLRNATSSPEWVQTGALADLPAVGTHLAWRLLEHMFPATAGSLEDYLREHPAPRVEALESHIRGLLAPDEASQHRRFTEAARLDERYAAPCFELGRMQAGRRNWRVAAEWLERVPERDVRFIEAAFLLGLSRYHMGDYAAALAWFERLAGSSADPEVINNLGAAQSRMDRPEAAASFRKAVETDPIDPDYRFNLGYVLWRRGEFAAAAESFRGVLDRRRDDSEAILFLGRALKQSGPRPGDPRSVGLERLKPAAPTRY